MAWLEVTSKDEALSELLSLLSRSRAVKDPAALRSASALEIEIVGEGVSVRTAALLDVLFELTSEHINKRFSRPGRGIGEGTDSAQLHAIGNAVELVDIRRGSLAVFPHLLAARGFGNQQWRVPASEGPRMHGFNYTVAITTLPAER